MSKDDAGCLTLIGLLILSISVGELYGGVYGWLTCGGGLMVVGLANLLRENKPR